MAKRFFVKPHRPKCPLVAHRFPGTSLGICYYRLFDMATPFNGYSSSAVLQRHAPGANRVVALSRCANAAYGNRTFAKPIAFADRMNC